MASDIVDELRAGLTLHHGTSRMYINNHALLEAAAREIVQLRTAYSKQSIHYYELHESYQQLHREYMRLRGGD